MRGLYYLIICTCFVKQQMVLFYLMLFRIAKNYAALVSELEAMECNLFSKIYNGNGFQINIII